MLIAFTFVPVNLLLYCIVLACVLTVCGYFSWCEYVCLWVGVVFWVGLYIIVSRYVCVYGCVFVYVIFGLKVCKFIYLFRSLCGTLYLVSL